MSVILKAENISKQYRLGVVGTGTLSHDLNRFWHRIRGKEDPYLKVGAINDRTTKADSDYVWALQDINFEVQKGEILGIIGKNGAGKSTLLKLLSRVTSPTTGTIKTKGLIASLLEVGTGFHPELTGRENVFLNGAILGMRKAEIAEKLNEIIDFSGCEKYIDTPVKRYSSGMRVRLAFAVAAHLEPDILIVDEVLAVGDAEFQKKAIGKMQDISRGDGRTVLFVSHNMVSIEQLCTRCIVLKDGAVDFSGAVKPAIAHYFNVQQQMEKTIKFPIHLNGLEIMNFEVENHQGYLSNILLNGSTFKFRIKLKNSTQENINLSVRYQIIDLSENIITTFNTYHLDKTEKLLANQGVVFTFSSEKISLVEGAYYIGVKIVDPKAKTQYYENNSFFKIIIESGDFYNTGRIPNSKNMGVFLMEQHWKKELF